MNKTEAESLRNSVISVYAEAEALMTFLAGYDFVRQSSVMKNHDAVRLELSNKRLQLESLTGDSLLAQASSWPDRQLLNRAVTLSKNVRTDAKYQLMLGKVERYLKASGKNLDSIPLKNGNNSRATPAVVAAPDYIKPDCEGLGLFADPSNYPSGVDLGIANGVALALHLAVDVTPSEILTACVVGPNPVRIAFAIASGITDQVANALQAVAVNAASCEKLRFNIEDKLKDDRGTVTVLANINYYIQFMYKSVQASLTVATAAGIPTQCGNAQLTLANAYFDGSGNFTGGTGANRLEAYRLLRNAYQNIGASSCQQ